MSHPSTLTSKNVKQLLLDKLIKYFSTDLSDTTAEQVYKSAALVIRDILLQKKQAYNAEVRSKRGKRVYYLCMEYLLGRNMRNNLYNLGLEKSFETAIGELGYNLGDLYELEADPGLGNGGLGRLAACFMDSLASLDYPSMGYSLLYEYGLFKQKIVENMQVELPDNWLGSGEVWLHPRSDKTFQVKFGGYLVEDMVDGRFVVRHCEPEIVEAQPYDLNICGANSDAISVLRLWKARSVSSFDMKSFTQGDYMMATKSAQEADILCKVLYPSDEHSQGKQLRLSQQYFLCSASLQNIFRDHIKYYGSLDSIADVAAIHINDTHPALAIPEMMRLLIDEHGYDWDKAWDMTVKTIAYTNHTVMAEALEKWSEELIALRLPRIYSIIKEINRRFCADAWECFHDFEKVERVSIISHRQVRMANLSVIGSHAVNGVSALHSDIIKKSIFADFYAMYPDRFTNVTNGIAHRRWLCQSNPLLTEMLTDLIGAGFASDASQLTRLEQFATDNTVLDRLHEIKHKNKVDFAKYIKGLSGFVINPDSRIDTQIKRLHEYKRQLLNVLKIIGYYIDLLENPNIEFTPQTFIFGAKAAGGYYHAKRIISLIVALQNEIARNPKIRGKLSVYFVENYNVSKAEHLFPASEVSEQISLAGKEASGTGNMKFMLNGAITLGTVDGANVEILQTVGADNIFTFGLKAHEVEELWASGYYSTRFFADNQRLKAIVEALRRGFDGMSFADIANYLVLGENKVADPYMCFVDFNDYLRAAAELDIAYNDRHRWNRMSLINIARAGIFAADRSISDYARDIWHMERISLPKQAAPAPTPKKSRSSKK